MNQKEYSTLKSLKNILDSSAKKVLLVTGKNVSKQTGIIEHLNDFDVKIFSDFEANPKVQDIQKGLAAIKGEEFDAIIACGGGSTIDTAKLIAFFYKQDFEVEDYLVRKDFVVEEAIPIVAIPTTAGTGSESTTFAAFYVDNKKYSVDHKSLLPKSIILDYHLTKSTPQTVAASSGIDALCQAIESYWNINSTHESKKYARKAIRLVLENLLQAVNNKEETALKNMLLAANLAGKAINITKTTAPHALSYYLTANYDVPHGKAVGLIMPYFLRINNDIDEKNCNDSRGVAYVQKTMQEIFSFFDLETIEECVNKFNKLMVNIGLYEELEKYCSFEKLLVEANTERLKNNPVRVS